MTEGRKTDQDLYEAIAKAYNNTGAYNDDAFPSIGFSLSKYDGPITWLQSKATFSVLSKEYEMAFNRSKQSGNHLNFSNFAKSKSILYMHEFVSSYPNVLSKITGTLPDGAKYDTVGGTSKKDGTNTYKRKRPPSAAQQKENGSVDALCEMNKINREKGMSLGMTVCISNETKMVSKLVEHKREKMTVWREIMANAGGRSKAELRAEYALFVEEQETPDGTYFESEHSDAFDLLYSLEDSILSFERHRKENNEKMKEIKERQTSNVKQRANRKMTVTPNNAITNTSINTVTDTPDNTVTNSGNGVI